MKIRSDYVSNSSSSSFIINFNDKGKCIDGTFMSLLKHTNYISVSANCKTKEEYDDIVAKLKEVFGPKSLDTYDDELYFYLNVDADKLKKDDLTQVSAIQEVLGLKNPSFGCGCGEDLVNAVQVATILETKFKDIEIEGDDHFDYNSIRGTELDDIGIK